MLFNAILKKISHEARSISYNEFDKYWHYIELRTKLTTGAMQMLGLAGWFVAVLSSDYAGHISKVSILTYTVGLIATAYLTVSESHIYLRLMGKFMYFVLLTYALHGVVEPSPNHLYWSLAICGLLVVSMSPLFHEPLSFLLCSSLINAIFFLPYRLEILNASEYGWIVSFIAFSTIFSISINYLFFLERISVYSSHRKLIVMAFTDSLTRINNRRAFLHAIDETMGDLKPGGNLFLLLIDVDDFKSVNDFYGHETGDLVLKEIANRIERIATPKQCGRLGGEEFGVFTVGSIQTARALAKDLNDCVAAEPIQNLNLSVSIGISKMQSGMTINQLLAEADLQMYLAKRAGKNQFSDESAIAN